MQSSAHGVDVRIRQKLRREATRVVDAEAEQNIDAENATVSYSLSAKSLLPYSVKGSNLP